MEQLVCNIAQILLKVMREAGYIYPFDWRRRRMDRDYEEPQGIRISVDR